MKITKFLLSGAVLLTAINVAQAEDTKIRMIQCGSDKGGGFPIQKRLTAEWEAENPGYKIDLELVPWGQCEKKATTLASAGDPVGLAYLGSRTLKQLAASELIVDLGFTDEEKATYPEGVLGTVLSGGKVWGAPRAFSSKALYYNKDLFTSAGLDPNAPPKTWDELFNAAQMIKDKTDAEGFGLAAASHNSTTHQFLNYVYTNGGSVIDESGNINFDSENNVEALEFYGKMASVSQSGPVAYDRGKLRPLFIEDKIAMYISGPWARGALTKAEKNWGVTSIPVGPKGKPGTVLITDSLAVFNGTGVEAQAVSFAKWLTNPANQLEFEIAQGLTPTRQMEGVQAYMEKDATWEAFIAPIPTGGPEPLLTDYIGLQDTLNEAVQSVVLGEAKAAEAISFAAEELENFK